MIIYTTIIVASTTVSVKCCLSCVVAAAACMYFLWNTTLYCSWCFSYSPSLSQGNYFLVPSDSVKPQGQEINYTSRCVAFDKFPGKLKLFAGMCTSTYHWKNSGNKATKQILHEKVIRVAFVPSWLWSPDHLFSSESQFWKEVYINKCA
jgi:hypothetical protein